MFMSIFKFIFICSIVITIFNVIWFFIELLIKLLFSAPENYAKVNRGVKVVSIVILSLLLAHESHLFASKAQFGSGFQTVIKVIGGIILFIYVVGKSEKRRINAFAGVNRVNISTSSAYPKWLSYVGMALYISGLFLPEISGNTLTNWFHSNIFDIYNTFLLKVIFGIIAFFFMIDIISRAFAYFTNFGQRSKKQQDNNRNDDDFDDYEIVDDNHLNE